MLHCGSKVTLFYCIFFLYYVKISNSLRCLFLQNTHCFCFKEDEYKSLLETFNGCFQRCHDFTEKMYCGSIDKQYTTVYRRETGNVLQPLKLTPFLFTIKIYHSNSLNVFKISLNINKSNELEEIIIIRK
jgi:hypothetical protein